jgi:hypothetical protein
MERFGTIEERKKEKITPGACTIKLVTAAIYGFS